MQQKINLNTASAAELASLPGIGAGLASRLITYRSTVGRFRTVAELAAVPGVSEAMVSRFADRVVAGEKESGDELPPQVVKVILTSPSGADDYTSHRLSATFTRRERLPGEDDDQITLWVGAQISLELPKSGDVTLTFPNPADIQGDVAFRVSAPDGETLFSASVPGEKLGDQLRFRVEPRRYAETLPNEDPAFGRPTKLRGRVIDRAGKVQIANRQVVIWGAQAPQPEAADFRAMIVVQTDASGYFSGPYPVGSFSAAHGDVSLKEEPVSVPIHLEDGGIFPESVILVVDVDDCMCDDDEDDCGCGKETDLVPRDPDMVDLARGDGVYSSDPGAGKCVDFTRPNRTLEEFSFSYVLRTTQPDIKGLTLEEPNKIDIRQIAAVLQGSKAVATAAFSTADASTPDVSLRSVAASAQTGFTTDMIDARVLKTLARDPDGFTLTKIAAAANLTVHGDLLRLLAKHIQLKPDRSRLTCDAPVDWDDEPTIYQACNIAHGHILHFKQEWVADGYSMGNLLYSLPLAPGQKKQIAIVDWERRESAARTEAIVETEQLDAAISRDRDINEVVRGTVSESVSGGSHSSTGSFGGGLGIAGGIFGGAGFLGGLLGIGGGTSSASSSAFQNSSRNTAASALNQLRDRTIQSASSVRSQRSTVVQTMRQGERVTATTETLANYNHCHAITMQYFEVLRHLIVRQRLVDVQECLFVPLLMSRFNRDKTLRWRNTLRSGVPRSLGKGFDALERIENNYVGSDLPVGRYADQTLDYLDGDLYMRFELARPRDKDDDFDAGTWTWLGNILPFINAEEFYKNHLKNQQFKDRVFLEQLGPQIAERFVQNMRVFAVRNDNSEVELPIDATLLSDFVNDRPLYVSVRLGSALPPLVRADIKFIKISGISRLGPWLFQLLPANSRVIVESGTMQYRTKYSSDYLFRSARIQNDIKGFDDVRIFTPLNRQELRNPREEDKELARNLLDFLNEHIEDAHHHLWREMSEERRYMLLDGFEAPNSGGKSVASVVDNVLIGIVGNCLVMPVSRGFHLDPTFRQDVENPIDLLEHYQPNTPIEPMRIALPTNGVYAESVMGACNSCEFKEEERFWRWEESPIPDSPTAILPVSTESRRAEPPNLTAKDFPAPIINMQTAPAAPDPTGLAAALQLLGTPNIFKDITGLEGTQKNALEALQGALDTAQFFGGKAADLALQAKMARDIDKAMRTIKTAKDNGLINDQQAQELTNNAIKSMIGGGSGEAAKPMTTSDVQSLAETAGQNKANIKVARPGGEKVEVEAKGEAAEDTTRPSIILPTPTNTADNRSFNASRQDKTGVIDLEATVRNAPAGSTFRWSPAEPGTITIDNPSSGRTRVRGVRPGKTAADFAVFDSGGTQLASVKVQLSIPQFVRVVEDAAVFDAALAKLKLDDVKNSVVAKAKEACESILGTANARTIWEFGGFSEAVPGHVPAANVMVATLRGDPPAGSEGLLGRTNAPGGLGLFNETIDIFPGGYDDPGASDIDEETQSLLIDLESATMTDPKLKNFAIEVYGRMLGETLAHEIVHGLLWDQINPPSDHNNPPIANDLMNAGADRSFRKRTGFENTALVSPVDPDNYIDHGIASIGGLQATNQALMNNNFPVPPAFA